MRSVLATHRVWGSQLTGNRLELAADEDEFTLGVAAAEGVLRGQPRVADSVYLIGDFPKVADWGFAAVLGQGDVKVVRSGMSDGSVLEAIHSAENESGSGEALVVAAAREGSEPGTGREWSAAALAVLMAHADNAATVGGTHSRSEGSESTVVPPSPGGSSSTPRSDSSPRPPRGIELAAQSFAGDDTNFLDGSRSSPGRGTTSEAPTAGVGRSSASGAAVGSGALTELFSVSQGAYVPYPRYRENIGSRWNFEADRCSNCGRLNFPIHGSCLGCGRSDTLRRERLAQDNLEVESATVVASGAQPTEFDEQVARSGPYGVVLVRLAPGVRATLQLAGGTATPIPIGAKVATHLRRLYAMEGEWRYGRKALQLGTEPSLVVRR